MKKILILSGKGGTGKTTTAAAFIKFAQAKAMADCDVDAPNLHLIIKNDAPAQRTDFIGSDKAVIDLKNCVSCGKCKEYCRFDAIEQNAHGYSINEYACEGCGVCEYVCDNDAIRMIPDIAGTLELYSGEQVFSSATLKMGRGNSGKLVTSVKTAMTKASDASLAIIDGSPGIGCPVMASVSGVSVVLIVTEPTHSGLSDLQRLIDSMKTSRTKIAVCVNKYDLNTSVCESINEYCRANNILFAGRIPYDPNISSCVNNGISIADVECEARDALFDIYEKTITLL